MGKLNLNNIQNSLNKAKDAAAPLQNKGHTENIFTDNIHLSSDNIYNENDNDEEIKELADNIETCGLLHPITVNKIGENNYQIISGERRFRAITEYLHWKSIPCMVFENLSPDASKLKLCMANLAVREYSSNQKFKFYLDVKVLLERMKESGEYKGGLQKGIAEILNVTKRQVAKYSAIERLSPEIQQDVLDGKISINKAIEMNSKPKQENSQENNNDISKLSKILDTLSETDKQILLSGDINLSSILNQVKKDEPVHHFDKTNPVEETQATEDTSKKDELVHHSKKSNPVKKNQTAGNTSEKDDTSEQSLQADSVIFYNSERYVPNKIVISEEHDNYTVFKVFAVKSI